MYEEDKIFGPLTLKQFITVAIGFTLSYVAYIYLPVPLAHIALALIVIVTLVTAFIRFSPKKFQGDLRQYLLEKKSTLPPEDYQKLLQRKLAELQSQIHMRASRGLRADPKLEEVKDIFESLSKN
ncbi:MAG: PrgI family protein [bacterium]|nr:PrgI family protein [bacterium]